MLFDSCPRMSRTDTWPAGRSVTGRGMPDICFGSGIWNWANAGAAKASTANSSSEELRAAALAEPRV